MKRICIVLAVFLSCHVLAQPAKGRVFLTGSLQFSTGFNGGNNPTYNLSPSAGYFTGDKNAIGLSVGLSRYYIFSPINGEAYHVNGLSLGLFDRKYFAVGGEEKFYFFITPGVFYTSYSSKDDIVTGNDVLARVSPGVSFFPVRSVGIEFSVPGLAYTFDGPNGILSFDARLSNTSVGISILLGGKKE